MQSDDILVSVDSSDQSWGPYIFTVDRSDNLLSFVEFHVKSSKGCKEIDISTHAAVLVLSENGKEGFYEIPEWHNFSFNTHLHHLKLHFMKKAKC